MVKLRVLAAATLASAVLGGSIGALATAATSSEASPQAVAAAVQKVKDSGAEGELSRIRTIMEQLRQYSLKSAEELQAICKNSKLTAAGVGKPSFSYACSETTP